MCSFGWIARLWRRIRRRREAEQSGPPARVSGLVLRFTRPLRRALVRPLPAVAVSGPPSLLHPASVASRSHGVSPSIDGGCSRA